MNVVTMNVTLTSKYPERLAAFYRDIVGLRPAPRRDSCSLLAGNALLLFQDHFEPTDEAVEPQRAIINLFVEDPAAEQARLQKVGVRFIRSASRQRCGGIISTFLDPDGNHCQLIQSQPDEQPNCGAGH